MIHSIQKVIIFTLLFAAKISHVYPASIVRQELQTNWLFRQERGINWYPATVPGTVHTDLMDNNIIEDPFYRLNERGVQWVDKEDWIYKTEFSVSAEIFGKQMIELHFKGLDTYADVLFNDSLILRANNMFREWKVNIKGLLKENKNELKIHFRSPLKEDMGKYDDRPYHIFSNNDQSENGGIFDKKVGVFARKAGYHYGWDWGPRLVTSGIWRPIYIVAWDDMIIKDVHYLQKEVNTSQAKLKVRIRILSVCRKDIDWLICSEGKEMVHKPISLVEGENNVEVDFTIDNPHLWWTNGLGEPYLYTFSSILAKNGRVQDMHQHRIGLRDLKVIRQKDKWGKSFYFELNGKPLFAKGANYIPQDSFLPRVSPERYKQTILDAVNANMNMLRVWGGGIYENDLFYELCDQYGILVWQDFMFACAVYPMTSEQLENVRQEAIDNVVRLRNHPCLAIWCGNNENHIAWFGWKWIEAYGAELKQARKDYKDVFHNLLPQVVGKYDELSFYWPSSPYSGNPDAGCEQNYPNINPEGDAHYWGVWGGDSIETYNNVRARFFSEYGFQSFPEYQSILQYAPKVEDHQIYSEVMMFHQRGGINANARIEKYMMDEYKETTNFRQQLYIGQLMQGDAIKTAIESHRRQMPYNMGSLFWQHNDCWPVASWSSRDYYGRWKAQHYYARKAYQDILLSPILEGNILKVYGISDRLHAAKGQMTVEVSDFYGRILFKKDFHTTISANSSQLQFKKAVSNVLKGREGGEVFVYVSFQEDGERHIYDNCYFLVRHKYLQLPNAHVTLKVTEERDGFRMILSSKTFVRGVFLSVNGIDNFFSDNYFNLYPHKEVAVCVKTNIAGINEFVKQINCETFSDNSSVKVIVLQD